MIIDSRVTSHFVSEGLNLLKTGPSQIDVILPNNSILKSSGKTNLPLTRIVPNARVAEIIPGLTRSLISINKMAENGYTTIFHPGTEGATIHEPGTLTITTSAPPVLRGNKNNGDKLWTISTGWTKEKRPKEEVANAYSLPSIEQTIKYLHAAAGYPTKETWIKAIRMGFFITWPSLTVANVSKHHPESDETQKGHMKRQRQGIRSTRIETTMQNEQNNANVPKPKKMRDILTKIHNAAETMHTDQTGRFPATSSSGNKYIMVMVEVDGNYIDAEPLKDKTAGAMIKAYQTLWKRITATGIITPTTHIMDNEASAELKAEIKKNCSIQLVPPDNHRRNLAERAIQTFKTHSKAILAGVDYTFPMRLWDKLIPQAILTLNLLRPANVVPTISAYQYAQGNFDYNKMPLAPLGCAVQLFENRDKRGTWAEHATDGWYIGTSPEHYRCHKIYVKTTRSERISDTVFFKHRYITQPTLTPNDTLVKAIDDLTHAIRGQKNHKGAAQIEALEKIDAILNNLPSPPKNNQRHITFDKSVIIPEAEITQTLKPTIPINLTRHQPSVTRAIIDKPLRNNIPTPRVEKNHASPRVNQEKKHTSPRVEQQLETPSVQLRKLRSWTQNNTSDRSQSHIQNNRQLQGQDHQERIQLVRDEDTGEYLNYRQLIKNPKHAKIWLTSAANEFGRLAQGVGGRVKGTDTIIFIQKNQVPNDRIRDVTYGSFTCDYRPHKEEKERTRLTAGGDRINYPDDVGTPTADMTLVKILFNSIISTEGAKCVMVDLKDFYLNTPMKRYEYMRLKITDIPDEIVEEYNLQEKKTDDGYIYCEIRKGMYGLPQAGIIAQELLQDRLAKVGYYQSKIVPGLWKHISRKTCFTLVVDDFAIKYTNMDDANHIINALKKDYVTTVDWEANKYIGLTVEWDYTNRKVFVHMPGYITKALQRFNHPPPRKNKTLPIPTLSLNMERSHNMRRKRISPPL